ncbi:TPA: DUF4145 domain-containing protein [Vibrio parahaemolyticus]
MSYWKNLQSLNSKSFTCGYCNNQVASNRGYPKHGGESIYICPHCDESTFIGSSGRQVPGCAPGDSVEHLPEELKSLYDEARNSVAASCFTGAVLLCRKLLMNIGVQQGAEEGKAFIFYIDYLAEQGYIPPNGRGWVDHIRQKGNEATHEIILMGKSDCDDLIAFSEMLLKFIYEFPNKLPKS